MSTDIFWIIITALAAIVLWLAFKLKELRLQSQNVSDAIKAQTADALNQTSRTFLDLATATFEKYHATAKSELDKKEQSFAQLVSPVKEMIGKLNEGMTKLEKDRKGEQEALKQQLQHLVQSEKELRQETFNLSRALRAPVSRGRWGEIQLKRVVELAGMLNFCDFYEQKTSDLGLHRPDLIVRLPGGRQVVIDAKVPLDAYLEALEIPDDRMRADKLKEHARQVKNHMAILSKKAYWEQFQPTPEFVILFLPSETFFSAALESDPSLIEVGVEQGVVLATPTTLIALLRAVAYGWKQEQISEHAQKVSELGQELYKRIYDMTEHWAKTGRMLSSAVESYNKAVGSMESRVLSTARKFKDLGAASSHIEIAPLEEIDRLPRAIEEHLASEKGN